MGKQSRFNIRLDVAQAEQIRARAAAAGLPVGAFLVERALAAEAPTEAENDALASIVGEVLGAVSDKLDDANERLAEAVSAAIEKANAAQGERWLAAMRALTKWARENFGEAAGTLKLPATSGEGNGNA